MHGKEYFNRGYFGKRFINKLVMKDFNHFHIHFFAAIVKRF